mmetsp:Transcript_7927/g.17100  ORF Transcript_7927/g.17100 Transcript_7927/m.17100 type:complete len:201 (-) Transcript_7927:489-1091(-)
MQPLSFFVFFLLQNQQRRHPLPLRSRNPPPRIRTRTPLPPLPHALPTPIGNPRRHGLRRNSQPSLRTLLPRSRLPLPRPRPALHHGRAPLGTEGPTTRGGSERLSGSRRHDPNRSFEIRSGLVRRSTVHPFLGGGDLHGNVCEVASRSGDSSCGGDSLAFEVWPFGHVWGGVLWVFVRADVCGGCLDELLGGTVEWDESG